MQVRPGTRVRLLLAALATAGAILRLWNLGAESFWHDESWTWGLIQGGPADVIRRLIRFDAHPPLYFLLLQAWSLLGSSEAWLRAFSALFGIAAIPLIHRTGSRIGGASAGLGAAALLAFNPYHVYFSREARSYALLFFLCLLSLDLLLDLASSPHRRKWIAYAAATTAILLTHYMGALFILGEVAVALILQRDRPGFFREYCLSQAGAASLFLPWMPTFISHVTSVSAGFWLTAPTPTLVWFSMCSLVVSPFFMGKLGYALGSGFFVLGLGAVRRRREIALAALLLIPPVGELLVTLHRPIFYTQTFQYVLIPLFLLIASGLTRLPPSGVAAAAAALCLAMAPGLYRTETGLYKENWRGAVAWMGNTVGPNERVVVQPGFLGVGLERYAPAAEWMSRIRLVDAGDMCREGLPRNAAQEEIRTQAPGLWLIFRHGGDEGWFDALTPDFDRIGSFKSLGVEVHHFRRKRS